MAVDVDDVVRCSLTGYIAGKKVQNVYHVQLEGEGDLADGVFKTSVMSKLQDMYTELNADTSEDLEYSHVDFFNLTQDKPMGSVDTNVAMDGTIVGARLPPAVAALVNFGTIVARSQGRKFLAGIPEVRSTDDGAPENDLLDALIAFAVEALAEWVVGQYTLQFGNYNTLLERFAGWASAVIPLEFKTQRRRYVSAGE